MKTYTLLKSVMLGTGAYLTHENTDFNYHKMRPAKLFASEIS